MKKILVVFGTRPEAIKLCPVVHEFRKGFRTPHPMRTAGPHHGVEVRVCITAQHRELLDQVLRVFNVAPEIDLNCMQPGQSLAQATSAILAALEPVFSRENPGLVVVQGDTSTTLCAAMAAFYARIPVAHVEAGLRTGDLAHPFPEELNRVVVSRIAALHFAATESAAENLRREGVDPARIHVTGNTSIDAVLYVRDRLCENAWPKPGISLDPRRKLIVVTAHRRESFGRRFEQICDALKDLASRDDVQIVYPVHPNPSVREPVRQRLAELPNVTLVEPLEYAQFVWLLMRASIVLTDSGGVQEEAPALGKPVLVMRDKTERPEAVEAGGARLVGASRNRIVAECARLLEDRDAYRAMAEVRNPYGDGHASQRIAAAIAAFSGSTSRG
jgi:UDP-N-acetylglucosamine 2-epimerase (non-hydrolysing)